MGGCTCFSYTSTRDRLYRISFSLHGLQSTTTHLADATRVHCWSPKTPVQSKPNLLLIHGFGANATWQWAPFLAKLGPHFNLYVPDLLFFGGSYTAGAARSESFQARTIMALMGTRFGVRRMSLVGISYGGFVGFRLAAEFPEVVERVVMCGAGVCFEERDVAEGMFPVGSVEEAAAVLMPQTVEDLRRLVGLSFYRPFRRVPACFLADFISIMCSEYVDEKRQLIEALHKDRRREDLPKITQSTLIIWGEQDQIFPLELAHRLKRHLGETAQMVVIKEAGHAVNIEKTKEMAKCLKSFLIEPITRPPSGSGDSLGNTQG